MKRNKHYQNTLPFFYKIYNVSAMKMNQLAQHVGGCVRGIFTDTIIVENPERKTIFINRNRRCQIFKNFRIRSRCRKNTKNKTFNL